MPAKNTVLAGVKSVTLCDATEVQLSDLSSQFFLRETDIGQRRDVCTAKRLAELNAYVPVRVLEGSLTPDAIRGFQAIVLTGQSLAHQLEINAITHPLNIKLIIADTRGLFGYATHY